MQGNRVISKINVVFWGLHLSLKCLSHKVSPLHRKHVCTGETRPDHTVEYCKDRLSMFWNRQLLSRLVDYKNSLNDTMRDCKKKSFFCQGFLVCNVLWSCGLGEAISGTPGSRSKISKGQKLKIKVLRKLKTQSAA